MADEEPAHDDLVATYWLHYRLESGERAERLAAAAHFWAWEAVDACIEQGGHAAVALIVELAEAVAGDDAALCHLGSGPIEDLLRFHGQPAQSLVAALDRAAEEAVSLQTALRCVWWGEDTDPLLVKRFSRFGPPL